MFIAVSISPISLSAPTMSFHEGLGVFRIHASNTFTLQRSTSKWASSSIRSSCESFRPSVIPNLYHLDTKCSSEARFCMVRVPKDKNDAFKQQVFQMQHSQITIESDKASFLLFHATPNFSSKFVIISSYNPFRSETNPSCLLLTTKLYVKWTK